jgi:hypothetical protein
MNTLGEFVEPEEPERHLKLRGGPDEEPRKEPKREPKAGYRLCDVCGARATRNHRQRDRQEQQ